jgi:hypothetical protein
MDQATTGVEGSPDPARAEREVDEARARVAIVATELDRRRRSAFDVGGQLRRHRTAIGVSAGALLLLLGGSIGFGAWRRRRQARPFQRVRRLRTALGRAIAHPEEVARSKPSVGKKVLGAGASAAAGVLARTVAQRLIATTKVAPH